MDFASPEPAHFRRPSPCPLAFCPTDTCPNPANGRPFPPRHRARCAGVRAGALTPRSGRCASPTVRSAGTRCPKASSTALIGFGLDSIIEVSSAAAVAWQFSAREQALREAREHRALRIVAVSFFALAAYVAVDAVRALAGTGEASPSVPGIVLAALSLAVMPFLSAAQRRAGRELGSASAVADSRQTLLCTHLSAVVLAGLVLNATLGWTWADPIAALVISAIAVKEGRDAWQGKGCCAAGPASTRCTTATGRTEGKQ